MENTRTEKATRSIFYGMINKIVGIFCPFLVRTVLIYKIGMEYAGLNSLFTSILSVLSLTELGFGSAMVYSMYKPIAENDTNKICKLLNLYKKVYRLIGLFIFIVGVLLIPFVPQLIKGDCPPDINLIILYLIYLFNTVISYLLFAYKQSLISAYMREDVNSKIITIVNLFYYIGQILVLVIWGNYYIYTILLPISSVLKNILAEIYTKKKFPNIICAGELEEEEKKSIFKNVLALAGFKFGDVLTSSFDNIVISALLGLTTLAIFSNYYYIFNAIYSSFLILDQVLIPIIGNCMVKEDEQENYAKLLNLQFVYVWIVGWCVVCFLCLYQHAITVWVGADNKLSFYEMVIFVVYFMVWKMNAIAALFKSAAGLWIQDKFRPYYSSIINLALNIILVKCIGVSGVLISTIVVFVFITIPIENHVTFKYYFKCSPSQYYRRLFFYILIISIAGFITYSVCSFLPVYGILWLVIKLIICCVVPNILFLGIYRYIPEFKYLKGIVSKVFIIARK